MTKISGFEERIRRMSGVKNIDLSPVVLRNLDSSSKNRTARLLERNTLSGKFRILRRVLDI